MHGWMGGKRRRVAVERRDPVARQRQFFARRRELGKRRAPIRNASVAANGVSRPPISRPKHISSDLLLLAQPDALQALASDRHTKRRRRSVQPRQPTQETPVEREMNDDGFPTAMLPPGNEIRIFEVDKELTPRFRRSTINPSFLNSHKTSDAPQPVRPQTHREPTSGASSHERGYSRERVPSSPCPLTPMNDAVFSQRSLGMDKRGRIFDSPNLFSESKRVLLSPRSRLSKLQRPADAYVPSPDRLKSDEVNELFPPIDLDSESEKEEPASKTDPDADYVYESILAKEPFLCHELSAELQVLEEKMFNNPDKDIRIFSSGARKRTVERSWRDTVQSKETRGQGLFKAGMDVERSASETVARPDAPTVGSKYGLNGQQEKRQEPSLEITVIAPKNPIAGAGAVSASESDFRCRGDKNNHHT